MFFQSEKLERISDKNNFNEIYFTVDDSISLNALHFKKENSDAIILLLHGNSKNLYSSPWINIINSLSKLNVDLFAIDYRGYGKSSGKTSLQGIYRDSKAALKYLEKNNPENKPIIIYGLSLGTIPAVKIAKENAVSGLILEGAISSTEDILSEIKSNHFILNFVKIKYDENLEFDNSIEIKSVKNPVLIIYGKNDNLSESMSKKLFNSINHKNKRYWLVEKGKHCDTYKVNPDKYFSTISDFINYCIKNKNI